jgi:hypothetical protein
MKIILSLLIAFASFKALAQEPPIAVLDTTPVVEEYVYKEPSKESKAYNAYRMVKTEPSYALAKIKKIAKGLKQDKYDETKVTKKQWDAFSLKEKFTYCMIHQESFSQNCDAEPPVEEEQKKIFAYIPDLDYEADLSNRQTDFLKKNKDSVLAWIKETATAKKRVGLNLKEAIIVSSLKQAIPFLVEFFNTAKKDGDILTTLLMLMENGKYKPHLQSQMREKLYGSSGSWPRFVNFNKANTELILKRAMEYYNAK